MKYFTKKQKKIEIDAKYSWFNNIFKIIKNKMSKVKEKSLQEIILKIKGQIVQLN